MNIEIYTTGSADFSRWLDGLRFCGINVATDHNGVALLVALVDDDGDGWMVDAADRDAVLSMLRSVSEERTKLIAFEADEVATALLYTHGLRLRGLRDAALIEKTHAPDAHRFETRGGYTALGLFPDEVKRAHRDLRTAWSAMTGKSTTTASLVRGWADEALLILPMRSTVLQTYVALPAHLAATVAADHAWEEIDEVEQRVEDLWRWIALDGYTVDTAAIKRALTACNRIRSESEREHGLDLSADDDSTRRWLRTRDIRITDADGEESLSHDHYDRVKVPDNARTDFDEFVRIRAATRDAGKLTELLRAQTDGAVTPRIDSYGAVTGRQAIRRPALHNLPEHLRPLLLAPEGCVLVGADLAHVEPSIAAALSGDEAFMDDVQPGHDPYLRLAETIWGDRIERNDPRRTLAKRVLIAAGLYGQGTKSLAYELGIDEQDARRVRDGIFRAYPRFAQWRKEVMRDAERGRTARTPYGRPLSTPRSDEAYKAINYLVQGTAADYFKRATIRVHESLDRQDALFLPIHDELIIACPPEESQQVADILAREMSGEINGVRITAEAKLLGDRLTHS